MRTIADITLNALRYDAECLTDRANTLARHAAFIDSMPNFRTAAEAELETAERVLKSALEKVRDVRANIRPAQQLQTAE
jgi:bacterioferritin (cytochrome b1)